MAIYSKYFKLGCLEDFLKVHPFGGFFKLPLAIHIESYRCQMLMMPLIRTDHRKQLPTPNFVEMVSLSDNRLKIDIRLVDELIPVEVVDCLKVGLTYFRQFLLKVSLHFRNAS